MAKSYNQIDDSSFEVVEKEELPQTWEERTKMLNGPGLNVAVSIAGNKEKWYFSKAILSDGSPVFKQLLCNLPATSSEPIEIIIDYVDEAIFVMLVKYLYTGEANIEMKNVRQLIKIAMEYEVDSLVEKCQKLLQAETPKDETCFNLLEAGLTLQNLNITLPSLDYICRNARQLFQTEDFKNISKRAIIEILDHKEDCFGLEVKVFDAVIRWGKAECERQKINPSKGKNLRNVLRDVIPFVWFSNTEESAFEIDAMMDGNDEDDDNLSTALKRKESSIMNLLENDLLQATDMDSSEDEELEYHPLVSFAAKEAKVEQHIPKIAKVTRGEEPISYKSQGSWFKAGSYYNCQETLIFSLNNCMWLDQVNLRPSDCVTLSNEYDHSDFRMEIKIRIIGWDYTQLIYEREQEFSDTFVIDPPLKIEKYQRYRIALKFKGTARIRSPGASEFKAVAAQNVKFVVGENYKTFQQFLAVNKNGDSESVKIKFERDPEDVTKAPIEEGVIEQFAFYF